MKKLYTFILVMFQVALIHAQNLEYSFVVVGCNRVDYLDTTGRSYLNPSTANTVQLNRLFTEVSQMNPLPEYLFFTGDIVMGYVNDTVRLAKQLNGWIDLYKASPLYGTSVKVVVIPGNHETQDKANAKKSYVAAERTFVCVMSDFLYGSNGPTVTGLIPGTDSLTTDQSRLSYSFNYKNDHFIIINTDPVGRDARTPYHWIRQDLQTAKANNARHIFAFGHKPAYASTFKPLDGLEVFLPQRDSLWKSLENNFTEAMFAAHNHCWDQLQPHTGKTWQVIAGNGGSAVETSWNSGSNNYFGYTVVNVYDNNEITMQSMGRDIEATSYVDDNLHNPTTVRATGNLTTGPYINHTPYGDNTSNNPYTITADIGDNVNVSTAVLNYKVNGVAQTDLTPTTSGSTYTFVIPAQAGNGTIEYAITAVDNFGQVSYFPAKKDSTITFRYGMVTSAIGADANNADLKVYPNPMQNELFIEVNSSTSDFSKYQIVDNMGHVVISGSFNQQKLININTSTLKSGEYIVRITRSNGSLMTYKLVK